MGSDEVHAKNAKTFLYVSGDQMSPLEAMAGQFLEKSAPHPTSVFTFINFV